MKRVMCIDDSGRNGRNEYLSIGDVYTVIGENNFCKCQSYELDIEISYTAIRCDKCGVREYRACFSKSRFIEIDELSDLVEDYQEQTQKETA